MKHLRIFALLAAATLAAGGWAFVHVMTAAEERRQRGVFDEVARTAAAALDGAAIARLPASPEGQPGFEAVRDALRRIKKAHPRARFVYLMGRASDGRIAFLADAEPHDSPHYSPPGQAYSNPQPALLRLFVAGGAAVEEPHTDDWGEWISALAAVTDPASGQVAGVIGIDLPAAEWREAVRRTVLLSVAVAGLTASLMLVFAAVALAQTRARLRVAGLNRALNDELARREELEAELRRLSATDALTGIANRRRFDEALETACHAAARAQLPVSLLMADLDYFKQYNDRYGHQAGDQLLREVAAIFRESARRPGDLSARFGGEEFAQLLPGVDEANAKAAAETLRRRIEQLRVAPREDAAAVTVSIGIATQRAGAASDSEGLVARADRALYAAKRKGRNRAEIAA